MFASQAHQVAYFPIPKVACSSTKFALYKMEHGRRFRPHKDRKPGELPTSIHRFYPSVNFATVDQQAIAGFWKFAIVRDPLSRLLSCYESKIVAKRLMHKPVADLVSERRAVFDALPKDPDINTFCMRLEDYRFASPAIRQHTERFSFFLGTDLSYFDRIYRMDEMATLARDLSTRSGVEVEIGHRNKSAEGAGPSDLSPEALEAVMRFLVPDYALLKAHFPAPNLQRT
jgi:hypothetical protein